MTTAPIRSPRQLPAGPACTRYVLLVTTRDPQPTLVPMANAHAFSGEICFRIPFPVLICSLLLPVPGLFRLQYSSTGRQEYYLLLRVQFILIFYHNSQYFTIYSDSARVFSLFSLTRHGQRIKKEYGSFSGSKPESKPYSCDSAILPVRPARRVLISSSSGWSGYSCRSLFGIPWHPCSSLP